MAHKGKKVAFCGTRGLPANYGGFETAVDEITRCLRDNGELCEVFCRLSRTDKPNNEYNGRDLVFVRGSKHRSLDTFISSIQTGLYILKNRGKYRFIFWFNNANFFGILLSLLAGVPMAINTDGLEWRREKWAFPFKLFYYFSTLILSKLNIPLISDSESIQVYYQRKFNKKTIFIPYGTPQTPDIDGYEEDEILKEFGLYGQKYFLQITRIEPDNLPLKILKGFIKSGVYERGYRLVIVGLSESTDYSETVKSYSGKSGILTLPAIYGQKRLYALRKNCYCYIHGNSVGGTNPALLEAMATCPRIIAIDSSFSREVLGDLGYMFRPKEIDIAIKKAIVLPDQSENLRRKVYSKYVWRDVANCYEDIVQGREPNYNHKIS